MGFFRGGEISRSEFEWLSRRVEELAREVAQLRLQEGGSPAVGDTARSAQVPRRASAPELAEVMALLEQGKKIQAIKVYRKLTGAGLREAKEAVERL